MSPRGGITLIIGVGDTGSHFVQLTQPAGMCTSSVRYHADVPARDIEKTYGFKRLETLLPSAGAVAMTALCSPQTHYPLNADRLGRLKSMAIVINAGRDDATGPEALADTLRNGWLHGAGSDITEPEPLPAENPLQDEPHRLITPYVVGGNHLGKASKHIIRIAPANVSRYAKQQGLLNLVRYRFACVGRRAAIA